MTTSKQHNKEKESEKRVSEMLNTAFGPTINTLLDDPTVTNIRLNPNGKLFYKKLKEGKFLSEESISKQSAEQIIRIVASSRGEICDSKNPIISSELPVTGYRFQGMLPPAVERASFAIRKKALLIYTLDDYVAQGILKPEWSQFIKKSIKEKKNILIVGGTDSGKTTFANAVLAEIAAYNDTILIIEDTYELQCNGNDVVIFRACDGVADMQTLLKSALRFDPDRIIVGEVRGAEALTLLDSWNTGHPGGLSTVHANSAKQALRRIEQLVLQGSRHVSKQMIADAVNVIVYIESDGMRRQIKEVMEVTGLEDDYVLNQIK